MPEALNTHEPNSLEQLKKLAPGSGGYIPWS